MILFQFTFELFDRLFELLLGTAPDAKPIDSVWWIWIGNDEPAISFISLSCFKFPFIPLVRKILWIYVSLNVLFLHFYNTKLQKKSLPFVSFEQVSSVEVIEYGNESLSWNVNMLSSSSYELPPKVSDAVRAETNWKRIYNQKLMYFSNIIFLLPFN